MGWSRLPTPASPPAGAPSPGGGLPRCWATKWKVRQGLQVLPGSSAESGAASLGGTGSARVSERPRARRGGLGSRRRVSGGRGRPGALRPRPQGPALGRDPNSRLAEDAARPSGLRRLEVRSAIRGAAGPPLHLGVLRPLTAGRMIPGPRKGGGQGHRESSP